MSLLDQSNQAAGVDTSLIKVIIVGVIGVLFAGACGYFLNDVLNGADNIFPFILSCVVFFSVFLLQVFFVKSFRYISIMVFLETVAVTSLFLNRFSGSLLLAWFLLLVLWILAIQRGRTEINNQLSVKFSRIIKFVLPHTFTAFAIFISILTVWVNGASLTKERFLSLIKPTQPIFQALLSQNFTLNMTVSKFAEMVIQTKLGVDVSSLPASARNLAIDQALNQVRTQYNIPFKSSDTFSDVIYNYLVQWIKTVPQPFQIAIPISAALLIFLTVKSFSIVVGWLVFLFAYILYELALATGFSRKALESRSHETIAL